MRTTSREVEANSFTESPNRVLLPGSIETLGATVVERGVNFALWAPQAERIELCLFDIDSLQEVNRYNLPQCDDGIWHGLLEGAKPGLVYAYRSYGEWNPAKGLRFNPSKLLLDPWAKQLAGQYLWNTAHLDCVDGHINIADNADFSYRCVVTGQEKFSSGHQHIEPDRRIIYESHVRGISQLNFQIETESRGKFAGLESAVMIDYLRELGVTTIQLMPVSAFVDEQFLHHSDLNNYWGYNTLSWFAPHPDYGTPTEFRAMVDQLHGAGFEIVIDVVYNHTSEGGEIGPHFNLKGLDNAGYYLLNEHSEYQNYTGCGNTLNSNSAISRRLVLESLVYWYETMGVDGFRFDLATTLGRTKDGFCSSQSLLADIKNHPVLSNALLIAEPWDLGPDGYQAGNFGPNLSEWNDNYRDDLRSFWLIGERPLSTLADRLTASRERYHTDQRYPTDSVQFISAHDGFCLTDLVSYSNKHNLANGENNRDGHNDNRSINFGFEGQSDDEHIQSLRQSRVRALLTTLLVSQGTPMLLMGDERGHSRHGNNNAWCQNNELNWLDWQQFDAKLVEFVKKLISLRTQYPVLRMGNWVMPDDETISWRRPDGQIMDDDTWHDLGNRAMQVILSAANSQSALLLINATDQPRNFITPDQDYWLHVDSSQCSVEKLTRVPAAGNWPVAPYSIQLAILDAEELSVTGLEEQGIQRVYIDANGKRRCAPMGTVKTMMSTIGQVAQSGNATVVSPAYIPDWRRFGERLSGLGLQLYALRSRRNWGIGDFEDLRQLAKNAPSSVEFLAINPLHARSLSRPHERSPYAPTSRLWLDPIYIAIDKVAKLIEEPLTEPQVVVDLRSKNQVDYVVVTDIKMNALADLCRRFIASERCFFLRQKLADFSKSSGRSLSDYVRHEAQLIYEVDPDWLVALQDVPLTRFLEWLQWLAQIQLDEVQKTCIDRGMRIGLYRDLAVGPALKGQEATLELFAHGFEAGAPPDALSISGQAWGVAVLNPHADGLIEYYTTLIESNMQSAGALRIDHVMGLSRMFWVPEGGSALNGAYAHYPNQLMSLLTEMSRRRKCLVVGEDLGTLPHDFRGYMSGLEVLGLSIAMFEKTDSGFVLPEHFRSSSVTCFSTHDLPTVRGWWQARDIEISRSLNMISKPQYESCLQQRNVEKERLAGMVNVNLNSDDVSIVRGIYRRLSRSPSALFQVQLDDLTGEVNPQNVPGTVDEYPNWTRKYCMDIHSIPWQEYQDMVGP